MPESKDQLPNRRQSVRHKVKLRILFQRAGAAHFVNAETDNISVDGVHIWSERRPLDVGTEVSILIRFEKVETELMLMGVVAWVQKHQPMGMGIRFKDVNAELKKVLSDALQTPEPPPTQ